MFTYRRYYGNQQGAMNKRTFELKVSMLAVERYCIIVQRMGDQRMMSFGFSGSPPAFFGK